eukprot:scaffold77778_cov54-Cyclotella_meneghiniana.AAC.2
MMQSRTILPILAVLLLLSPPSYVSSQNTRGGIVQPNNEEDGHQARMLGWLSDLLKKLAKEAEEAEEDMPTSRPVAAGAGVLAGQEAQETFPSPTSSPTKSPVGTAGQKQNQKTSDNSKNKNSKTDKKKSNVFSLILTILCTAQGKGGKKKILLNDQYRFGYSIIWSLNAGIADMAMLILLT